MRRKYMSIVLLLGCIALVVLAPVNAADLAGRLSTPAAQSDPASAPDVASYRMDVRLDPTAKTVTGTGQITYRNPSQDTLNELWLRLYMRAFSSDDTVWMQESGGSHRGYSGGADQRGNIEVTSLTSDGQDLLATSTITDTLMRVPLTRVLAPDQTIVLDVAWTTTLPRVFARTGYGGRDDTFFMVGQWYPKMAVYDRGRWDTEPWHTNAEFFHDFGTYDVTITTPESYVVAATGTGGNNGLSATPGNATVQFQASSVTDFAWAASPDFQTRTATVDGIEIVLYYLPEHSGVVEEYMRAATGSLASFSAWFGTYPWPRLSVVDVPDNAGGAGGMEYPTLVTGGTLGLPGSGGAALVTAHEIAHQWWPMQTATNEAREPWLDEGLTEYSGIRYMVESETPLDVGFASLDALSLDRTQYAAASNEPATLPAWEYDGAGYGGAVYGKTAVGLWTLENIVGTERFRTAMRAYLDAYRWKHPTREDFQRSLETSLGGDLGWFFDQYMDGSGVIDYAVTNIEHGGTGEQGAFGDIVRVRRDGDVQVPVDVYIRTASGAEYTQQWDGIEQDTSFTYGTDDPVVEAIIDPDYKLVAELDRTDNVRSEGVLAAPAMTLGARIAALAQLVTHMLGLFG